MWAFSPAPPKQLIYGDNRRLFLLQSFFGSASIIIIKQNRIFLVEVPVSGCVCVVFYLASVWTVGERWLGHVWFMKSSSSYPSRNKASCLYGILLARHGTARHWVRQSVIRAGQRVPRWVSDLKTLLFKWPPVEIVSHTTETQCLCVHGKTFEFINPNTQHPALASDTVIYHLESPSNK